MRLLLVIALVIIAVLFFTRKSAAKSSSDDSVNYNTDTPPTPGELADLEAQQQNYGPTESGVSLSLPGGVELGIPVTLPGGIDFTFHGNPNDFPDINDQNGDPYAIASGRGY